MLRLLLGLTALGLCAPARAADPPALKREFRAVWVATVSNIDWPSKPGLSADQQKKELLAILDNAVELKLNAVIFQVRPMADALYASELEPWSEYLTGQIGKAPGYDPLAFAVAEAHTRGLELHAWFNPYRARHPSAKSPAPADHLTKKRPDLAKPYGTHAWMNPTNPEVQEHSLRVFLDVVKRYDIDGIHIDDYFYPYKEKGPDGKVIPFPDDDTWEAYQKQGGKLSRDDWRRDAVNVFVRRMYEETKKAKPWVKVGISPFGIWRPGHPAGIAGLDQYAELYADAKLWFNEGWVDYFTPQLYWPIAQEKQSFPKLLDWWAGENTKKRHLWPGLYTSRVTGAAKGWNAKEIGDQIAVTRQRSDTDGAVHFSAKALVRNTGGIAEELKKVYAEPALVPASNWLAKGNTPAKPEAVREMAGGKAVLRVKTAPGTRFVVVRAQTGDRWVVNVSDASGAIAVPETGRIVVTALDRVGRESEPVEVK
ncbi:family 10 glycosylhydrolase [Gemmata sp. JC717]|uniref:glycoside hydrolase family 10 protein n=1 Tax=Gemmata algarum TaxID=2975278 RepID=UPI0021BA5B13|nr:family 10 glycosylhydrolase [Gemmata algarum]MDY3556399.1 family 10 glycosylhydrolase [Gemmata algarum]